MSSPQESPSGRPLAGAQPAGPLATSRVAALVGNALSWFGVANGGALIVARAGGPGGPAGLAGAAVRAVGLGDAAPELVVAGLAGSGAVPAHPVAEAPCGVARRRAHGLGVAGFTEARVGSALEGRQVAVEVARLTTDEAVLAFPIRHARAHALDLAVTLGRALGVLTRDAFTWTGRPDSAGPPVPAEQTEGDIAIETEVAYVRLGDLHIAGIPGEIYPELIYGSYQSPPEPNADFPDAPTERALVEMLPGPTFMVFGLANDEVGYIIPMRQWDEIAPFAYDIDGGQYGERNSVGAEVAPILMRAFEQRVREAPER